MTDKLREMIIAQVQHCNDADLLDLVYKLLLAESGEQLLDAGVLVGG